MERLKERFHFAHFCMIHMRSAGAIRRWQEKYLRRLIDYAGRNVPLWRRLLSERDITPGSIRSLTDLRNLPVTDKQTYIGLMPEEYVDSTQLAGSYWHRTSGTSGTPFSFLSTRRAYRAKYVDVSVLRFLWWLGEWSRRLSTIKIANIKIRAHQSAYRFFISVKEFQTDPRKSLSEIVQFDPEIIASYPSMLLVLARVLASDTTIRKPNPRFIISFGEMLSPSARAFIEAVIGGEIYNRYALEEIGAIGLECAQHDGFHINSESVIVEILDANGAPLESGKQGRVIVTDLFNYAMPFIRYDTGDHGVMSVEECACGLRTPRIWIKGRYSAFLSFPSRAIHHLEFDGAMDGFMNDIVQYQIAKMSDAELRARIVPGPTYRPAVNDSVKKELEKLVDAPIRVSVETVASITPAPRGKSRIVVDESVPSV